MTERSDIIQELKDTFGPAEIVAQATADRIPTLWVGSLTLKKLLRHVKQAIPRPYWTLYDLTAIDERKRSHRDGQPASDFTVVDHLVSY